MPSLGRNVVRTMWRKQQREKLKVAPFPARWSRILEDGFPLYACLADGDRKELQGHILVFLAENSFEGFAKATRHVGSGVMEERQDSRLGEAWDSGAVVLAWDAVHAGTANPGDGHNVVFHEFAHQLDFEDGRADGTPVLAAEVPWYRRRSRYKAWPRVLSGEYEKLRANIEEGKPTIIDEYGATNPAEFFAVATEAFFERPRALQERHPKLYEELKRFYRQDPLGWAAGAE
jgi:Mlc titration factor MtfA (ptsG expression regulator)